MSLSELFHVGRLDKAGRTERPYFSHEGCALSVTTQPEAWRKILRLGEAPVYRLTHPKPKLYDYYATDPQIATDWSIDEGYLVPRTIYVVRGVPFWTKEEARAEYPRSRPKEVQGFGLGPNGRAYWKECFEADPDDQISAAMAVERAPLWYAEAHGYDGVWWDDVLDVSRHSAPRGALFQSRLDSWTIERLPGKKLKNRLLR